VPRICLRFHACIIETEGVATDDEAEASCDFAT
jgi:hypothetical protein